MSVKVKSELLSVSKANSCCIVAELSAIFHTSGSVNISREGLYAEISSENDELIKKIMTGLKVVYNISATVYSEKKSSLKRRTLYTLQTPKGASEQFMTEIGMIYLDENGHRQIASSMDKYLVEENCCATSYLRGAFLACGSLTIPDADSDNASAGYHLEFYVLNKKMGESLCDLMARFDIFPKLTKRQNGFMVYIKESEAISDLLALMGAANAVLRLQAIKVEREVKNNTNRQTNCILANIDKTVDAAVRQIAAINLIEKTIGLDMLPPKLKSIAKLRQEYPDVSLEQIAALSGEKLTKSGINHRMRKIIAISEEL